jgi:hypothetical protein
MEKKSYRGKEEEEMLACAVMDREASILLLHPVSANVGEQARTSAAPSRSRCGSSGAPERRSGLALAAEEKGGGGLGARPAEGHEVQQMQYRRRREEGDGARAGGRAGPRRPEDIALAECAVGCLVQIETRERDGQQDARTGYDLLQFFHCGPYNDRNYMKSF